MKNDKNIFGIGQKNVVYAQYFDGKSFLNGLISPQDNIPFSVANVTFESGCRNHWHAHTDGFQILLAISGNGWYQEWGKKPEKLLPGDVVVIKQGIKHWHGAAKNSSFSHLAITQGPTEWYEPLSKNEYDNLD